MRIMETLRMYATQAVSDFPHITAGREKFTDRAYFIDREGTSLREDAFSVKVFVNKEGVLVRQLAMHLIDATAIIKDGDSYHRFLLDNFKKGEVVIVSSVWQNALRINYKAPVPVISIIISKPINRSNDSPTIEIKRMSLVNSVIMSQEELGTELKEVGSSLKETLNFWPSFRTTMSVSKTMGLNNIQLGSQVMRSIFNYTGRKLRNYAQEMGVPMVITPGPPALGLGPCHKLPDHPKFTAPLRFYYSYMNMCNLVASMENREMPYSQTVINKAQVELNKQMGLPDDYKQQKSAKLYFPGGLTRLINSHMGRVRFENALAADPEFARKTFMEIAKDDSDVFVSQKINTLEVGEARFVQIVLRVKTETGHQTRRTRIYKTVGMDELQSENVMINYFWKQYLGHKKMPVSNSIEYKYDLEKHAKEMKWIAENRSPVEINRFFKTLTYDKASKRGI